MIEPSTLAFLKNLAANNNREWFNDNKKLYEQALANVLDFSSQVITGLSKADDTISPDLNPKSCVLRIYRDIRFSNDKTPFKTNFGIGISQNGKNFHGPGYYMHIQPGLSFTGGGAWFPQPDYLRAIRQEIDYNSADLREILNNSKFKKHFPALDREGALKTTPKGYPADHPEIELLKLKSFTTTTRLEDKSLEDRNSVADVVERLSVLHPFILFLRNAIS